MQYKGVNDQEKDCCITELRKGKEKDHAFEKIVYVVSCAMLTFFYVRL